MLVIRRGVAKCLRNLSNVVGRYASTQRHTSTASETRNIALVAHIDSGKTTLTESILLTSHYLSSPGSVDTGSTTTDFLPAERERGITIQSASIPVKWDKYTYNLVDTPGHADFGMEVESASRVVDGAVVLLDSVEGVEAQTKGVWRQLDRYNVPTRLMFFNKLDRPGASLHSSYLSVLANRLHPQPVMLTLPIVSFDSKDYSSAEPGIQGVVDLVNWEVWKSGVDGCTRIALPNSAQELAESSPFSASHPLLSHLIPARTQLLECLGMHSEGLLDLLLALPNNPSGYLSVPPSVIMPYLRELTLQQQVLPIVCGSALKHIGTELLLNYVGALLASPLDVQFSKVGNPEQVQLLAWKVSWDKRRGWMTFVRVYSGTLTKGVTLLNVSRDRRERASKLLLLYASQPEEIDFLPFGSIGVILGLKHTRTGDTLVSAFGPSASSTTTLREITPPPAVISASVIPNSYSDLEPVQEALSDLTRTDPSTRVEELEGQLLIHGLGALHLEIVEGRLRDEWGAQFQLGRRRVSYRESYSSSKLHSHRTWETQIAGQPVTASISITIRPFENGEVGSVLWGDNLVVDDEGVSLPSPDAVSDSQSPLSYLVQGLHSTLSNSHRTGLPLSHIHTTIHSYTLSASSPPSALAGASSYILREMLNETGMGPLMEPYVKVKVEVSEDVIGKVVKDLTDHRGEILDLGAGSTTTGQTEYDAQPYPQDSLYVPPDWLTPCSALSPSDSSQAIRIKRSVHAIAPLSQMLDYSGRLRAISGGHGLFEMSSEGFREVGEARKFEILKELGRA